MTGGIEIVPGVHGVGKRPENVMTKVCDGYGQNGEHHRVGDSHNLGMFRPCPLCVLDLGCRAASKSHQFLKQLYALLYVSLLSQCTIGYSMSTE